MGHIELVAAEDRAHRVHVFGRVEDIVRLAMMWPNSWPLERALPGHHSHMAGGESFGIGCPRLHHHDCPGGLGNVSFVSDPYQQL